MAHDRVRAKHMHTNLLGCAARYHRHSRGMGASVDTALGPGARQKKVLHSLLSRHSKSADACTHRSQFFAGNRSPDSTKHLQPNFRSGCLFLFFPGNHPPLGVWSHSAT